MSLRIPTEADYERLLKVCEENNVADVMALLKEVAMDLNREFGHGIYRVSACGMHAIPSKEWIASGIRFDGPLCLRFADIWIGTRSLYVIVLQQTALHIAGQKGHAELAMVLIREGADLEARDSVSAFSCPCSSHTSSDYCPTQSS